MSAAKQVGESPRIQIATVDIRVLKIGSKQMTQAVFNQLEHSELINSTDGTLSGSPWGWVNYKTEYRCRHAVFERSGRLFRSIVTPMPHIPGQSFNTVRTFPDCSSLSRLISDLKLLSWRHATESLIAGDIATAEEWEDYASFEIQGYTWTRALEASQYYYNKPPAIEAQWPQGVTIPRAFVNSLEAINKANVALAELENLSMGESEKARISHQLRNRDEAEAWLEACRQRIQTSVDGRDHLTASIIHLHGEVERLLKRWSSSFAAVEEAGQLFIAV